MKQLFIEGTKNSPRVELNPSGEIKIQGRCIMEDSSKFFNPIFLWVKYATCKTINIEINLEYINTSSVKQLFSLLLLVKSNHNFRNIYVNWYYEEGDDDNFELGKDIESVTKLPIDFFEYKEQVA